MEYWETLFNDHRFDELEDICLTELTHDQQCSLLAALKRLVPTIEVKDSFDAFSRLALPSEVSDDLKGAVRILQLGELEAAVMKSPPTASEFWRAIRDEASRALSASSEIENSEHNKLAHECLASVDMTVAFALQQVRGKKQQEWYAEMLAEVASAAFEAGREVQLAWGKPFERHTRRGQKSLRNSSQGGVINSLGREPHRQKVVAEMQKRIDLGMSVRRAADLVFAAGIGTSGGANSKLWYKYGPKQKKL